MKTAERREEREGPKIEFQLDTAQILLVVAGLAALCVTSFVLGRWTERDLWRETTAKTTAKNGKITETDAGSDLTFFDTLGTRNAEPHRQAAPSPPAAPRPSDVRVDTPDGATGESNATAAPPPAPSAPAAHAASPAPGEFAVQVFAGDRAQADKLVASLSRKGYTARVLPGTKGPSSARVRVYGYRTRADADRGADRLRRDEKLTPWVVKSD